MVEHFLGFKLLTEGLESFFRIVHLEFKGKLLFTWNERIGDLRRVMKDHMMGGNEEVVLYDKGVRLEVERVLIWLKKCLTLLF